MSEASTTDDYVTANNSVITETSGNGTGTGTHGSSFESASSKYSLDRDKSEDFQIVSPLNYRVFHLLSINSALFRLSA